MDVSDVANPHEVGYYHIPDGYVLGIYVAGDYAYLANAWNGLLILDVSDPMNPFEVGQSDTPGDATYGVHVVGSYA
jgi:hypothetical protein